MARQSRARGRSSGRSRSTSRNSYRTGTIEIFTRPHQNPYLRILGFLVRFRAELSALTVTITVTLLLRGQIGPDQTALTLGAVTVFVVGIPASRRYLIRRAWCVTSRHRIRACFNQTRTMTHDGRLPLLLWSRPSPVGERVRVWLPAGLSVKDINNVTPQLAAACWARESRVTPTRSQAALVIVDIVRRDPLATSEITPVMVEDLDPAEPYDPDIEGTVVTLPTRESLAHHASTQASTDKPAPSGPTTRTTPAAGRNGKNATARGPVDDEDADPSL